MAKKKKKVRRKKIEKNKKLDFKDFAKQDSSELKVLAGFFIVLALWSINSISSDFCNLIIERFLSLELFYVVIIGADWF